MKFDAKVLKNMARKILTALTAEFLWFLIIEFVFDTKQW